MLIKGKNDSKQDADDLAAIAKRLRAKVNLIPFSPVFRIAFQPPERKEIDIFMKRLVTKRVNATLRESKGAEIRAACGQLAGRQNFLKPD